MGGAAGLAGAAASMFRATDADAKLQGDIQPRGQNGRLERLPTLDLEANDEFLTTMRIWVNGELSQAAAKSAATTLKAKGIDPTKEMPREQALEALKDDPMVAVRNHNWQRLQVMMWDNLKREFHGNYDAYMAEMEAADKAGPGKLELNPGIEPLYTKHEIHMQPGGYTGDPFAGHIYHYGTNNFYNGGNYQDELHMKMASAVPVPKDGKVLRILDQGCSCGQLTVALKQRFPDAEVWGVDIGGPMVRYAHMRANDIGLGPNFRQALAESTGFPDGYFDIVTSYIMHHEVPAEKTMEIIKEANRVSRPGAVYAPLDFVNGGLKGPASSLHSSWIDHRWNNEVWSLSYHSIDFSAEIAKRGYKQMEAKSLAPQFGARHFVKA